jgi:serine/threonine-protein kinase
MADALCPSCGAVVPSSNRFCGSCGRPVGSESGIHTTTAGGVQVAVAGPGVARLISSDSIPVGGFTPGTLLDSRYRIVGLLGRGGMGEVYRADDLKLGQPVALKFLPAAFASDPVRRERFFAEVRITRQLAHPNICRVYDIAEVNGQHFLSMEFIDGEDLGSLIKRIGYLPGEKALDIARQLVAGLAAAHDKGVLHRDLKPANVMIDGRGRVRITDFGLAIAADEERPEGEIPGTPAYMAPEQLAGKGASVRSDIYALGLVLYEIYSGRRAFAAPTLAELRAQKESHTPPAPSELRPNVDPVVERVIQRCIERDPRQRPASAAQVAAALPGGDPLAAAIAAGETPSPEMVAASGPQHGINPALAVLLLAIVAVGMTSSVIVTDRSTLFTLADPPKPPDALVELARQHLRRAGYPEAAADSAGGFRYDDDYAAALADRRISAADGSAPPRLGVLYWYRHSPKPIERYAQPLGVVSPTDPPLNVPGEALLEVDVDGNLRTLRVIPPKETSPAGEVPVDWAPLFEAAGLDLANWTPTTPQRNPESFADMVAAWTGTWPYGGAAARIEAASLAGRPVSFSLTLDILRHPRTPGPGGSLSVIALPLLAIGVLFARRNYRLGRGDRRGAARIAVIVPCMLAIGWVLSEHHVATFWELNLFLVTAGMLVALGAALWILYMALEPFIRRHHPRVLVSWTRLLSGDWRDPLLGRDVLAGVAAATLPSNLSGLVSLLRAAFFDVHAEPTLGAIDGANGLGDAAASLIAPLGIGTAIALFFLLAFVIVRRAVRRDWAAALTVVLALTTLSVLSSSLSPARLPGWWLPPAVGSSVFFGSTMFVLLRFGLVGGLTMGIVEGFFFNPLTFRQTWYSGLTYAVLAIIAVLSLWAFRTAIGSRRVFNLQPD